MERQYVGHQNGKHVFKRGDVTFVRGWRPLSHSRPQTPSQLKAEIQALER